MTESGPWLDPVHWIGILSGALALAALTIGLTIALRKGGGTVKRMRRRTWHMVVGTLAVALALAHVAGRMAQGWSLSAFALHDSATLAFPLVLIAGWLRHRPPGLLQERMGALVWAHRVAVLLTFALLAWHVRYQMGAFSGN